MLEGLTFILFGEGSSNVLTFDLNFDLKTRYIRLLSVIYKKELATPRKKYACRSVFNTVPGIS